MRRRDLCTIMLAMLMLGIAVHVLSVKPVRADTVLGDVNGDGIVDLKDLYKVYKAFGSQGLPNPSPNWDPLCDLNSDNSVDTKDVYLVC